MFKLLLKTAIILVFLFLIYLGAVKVLKHYGLIDSPLTTVSDVLTGQFELEQKKRVDESLAIIKCQELCQYELTSGSADFNMGACLAEEIIPDWSCDIAHSPRQAVDDDPANQCASFRQGLTHHFVEVDGNCNRIKVY